MLTGAVRRVTCAGTRAPEMALRLKYAGWPEDRIAVEPDIATSLDAAVAAAVSAMEDELGDAGRVLLRKSGTEPVVRVMVEADTAERAQAVATHLADVVKRELSID